MGISTGFMNRFGRADSKPSSSFTSHEDSSETQHAASIEAFVQKFGRVTEEYSFKFTKRDHSIENVSLRFDKDEHTYYRVLADGSLVKVPGITTIVGIKDKSMALMPWAANETADYVKAEFLALEPEHYDFVTKSSLHMQDWLFTTLDEAKKNYKNLSKAATDIGHAAHDWLENYVNAQISQDPSKLATLEDDRAKLPEKSISCCEAGLQWMRAHNVRWKATERKVYSLRHNYAGTLDGVCVVDSCNDPECCPQPFKDVLSIIDWKSSNALYDTYRWQTAAYEEAYEEETGADIRHRWLIQLGKYDGSFKAWHMMEQDFNMDFQCFAACLLLMKSTEQATEILRARRAAAKAAKKEAKEEALSLEKALKASLRLEAKEQREREREAARLEKLARKKAA